MLRVLAVAVLLAFPTNTVASDRPVVTIGELLRGSDTAIVAHVESVVAQWHENDEGDRVIVSKVLLRVEETFKGAPAGAQWIDLLGGTLDGLTLRVSSLPTLRPGERAVFFLERRPADDTLEPHRRGQGILPLDENDVVRGTSIALAAIRAVAQGGN